MTTIFYIHGFGSSIQSDTLKLLQKSFPTAMGLTYDHTTPSASILNLVKQLQTYNDHDLIVVGSSLGGWYTEQLTNHIVANFIMYNPATQPEVTLANYGVPQDVLYEYKRCQKTEMVSNSRNVIISIDDTVISPTKYW